MWKGNHVWSDFWRSHKYKLNGNVSHKMFKFTPWSLSLQSDWTVSCVDANCKNKSITPHRDKHMYVVCCGWPSRHLTSAWKLLWWVQGRTPPCFDRGAWAENTLGLLLLNMIWKCFSFVNYKLVSRLFSLINHSLHFNAILSDLRKCIQHIFCALMNMLK